MTRGREASHVGELLDSVKGFGVTFSHMFRKVVTSEYPERPDPVARLLVEVDRCHSLLLSPASERGPDRCRNRADN